MKNKKKIALLLAASMVFTMNTQAFAVSSKDVVNVDEAVTVEATASQSVNVDVEAPNGKVNVSEGDLKEFSVSGTNILTVNGTSERAVITFEKGALKKYASASLNVKTGQGELLIPKEVVKTMAEEDTELSLYNDVDTKKAQSVLDKHDFAADVKQVFTAAIRQDGQQIDFSGKNVDVKVPANDKAKKLENAMVVCTYPEKSDLDTFDAKVEGENVTFSAGHFSTFAVIDSTFEIKFKPNGGIFLNDKEGGSLVEGILKKCAASGKSVSAPTAASISFNSYELLGWSEDKNAETPTVKPGAAITVNSAKTYYAVWKWIAPNTPAEAVVSMNGYTVYVSYNATPAYTGKKLKATDVIYAVSISKNGGKRETLVYGNNGTENVNFSDLNKTIKVKSSKLKAAGSEVTFTITRLKNLNDKSMNKDLKAQLKALSKEKKQFKVKIRPVEVTMNPTFVKKDTKLYYKEGQIYIMLNKKTDSIKRLYFVTPKGSQTYWSSLRGRRQRIYPATYTVDGKTIKITSDSIVVRKTLSANGYTILKNV